MPAQYLTPDLALLAAAALCLITWNAVAVMAVARRRLAGLEASASPTARATDETPAADVRATFAAVNAVQREQLAAIAAIKSGETIARALTPIRSR
jgi:hypothetical protein